jgi:alkylation response protein AidB-like acyl-CoA dehydrogenase
MALRGFLDIGEQLSPHTAGAKLSEAAKLLTKYNRETVWEIDTRSLPVPLQQYRRRMHAFAGKWLTPYALQQDTGPDADTRSAILVAAARAGLFSDMLPQPFGTASWLEYRYPIHWLAAIKMEELCSACGGIGLMIGAHALGACPLIFSGSLDTYRRHLLPLIESNKKGVPEILAFAITEPGAGSDVEDTLGAQTAKPGLVARQAPGGYILNGRKVFISGGDHARFVCTMAALEGQGFASSTFFLAEKGMPGFSCGRNEKKMGQRASSATELIFEDCFVPVANVIGGEGRGWALARTTLNYSRIPVGAIALGIARGAVENAIEFCTRNAIGGKELVHYQDVQIRLAKMLMACDAMRGMLWHNAASWTARQFKASAVKVFCSDTAVEVCLQAMDILGNHALMHGNRVEKAYRDARLTQIYEGTNQINLLAMIEDQMFEFEPKN